MPYPQEYQVASNQFQDFLTEVKSNCDFGSIHMAYTVTQGVLQAFRRRLSLEDAIRFSNLLPACLRALFVAQWDPFQKIIATVSSKEDLKKEIQSLREDHNYTYLIDDPVSEVYKALLKSIDHEKFNIFLDNLPVAAKSFWRKTS